MGKGGGSPSTNFNAKSVPQSLYGLGGDINYFRQHDLEPLLSAPQSISNWALNAAGVPVQQTTPGGSFYNIQTYGGQGGTTGGGGTYATGGGQTGSNPYYQAASNLWNQLGTQAQNLIGQGQQEYGTGSNIVGTGQGIVSQGQGAFDLGQNLVNQGVSGAYTQGIDQLQNIISQYPQIEAQLNQLPSYQAIMSTGLTPEQQAYVTQATQAQQAAVTQQLQTEGLGSSTMMAEKLGAAQQAGAATAGSLIQGNIQAATQAANAAANAVQERINQEQQGISAGANLITGGLGLTQAGVSQEQAGTGMVNAGANVINAGQSEQSLGLSSQTSGANYLNTIATANVNMQQQLYSEAMQGYGVLGQLLNTQMQVYGYQLQGEQIKVSGSGTGMQVAASQANAQQDANSKAFSGLISGVGTAVGTYAGSAAGSAAIGTALSAAGALFCAAGREIFGVENPEWYLMRDVMLFSAPKWFRKAYIRHAQEWARYLSARPRLKRLVRTVLRRILASLTHAQSGFFKKF